MKSQSPKKSKEQKPKNKGGRPTDYNESLAEEICMAIAFNNEGLEKLISKNPHFPNKSTILRWAFKIPEFHDQYARARVFQAEFQADWALEVAIDGSKDTIVDDNVNERCNNEWIARSRLIVDTIKWRTGKLVPKLYGDKTETTQNVTINEKVTRMKSAKKSYEPKE